MAQEEKYLREKQKTANDISSADISTEHFNFAKHVGQFAVNIYYSSWLLIVLIQYFMAGFSTLSISAKC